MKILNRQVAWVTGFVIAGVLATSSLVVAQAAEFIMPKEDGNVTVSADEQHKNLYVVGSNVLVNSNTTGDLYIAGGNVTIEGDVEGDLTLAGGTAYINGKVGGDVRALSGNLTLNDTVGGDLVVAAGTVVLNEKAIVSGDLIAAAAEMSVLGSVLGQVKIHSDILTIDNAMQGNVQLNAREQLIIGSKAVFGNTAKYKSMSEAQVENGAQLGGLQFEKLTGQEYSGKEKGGMIAGILTLGFVIKLLASIVAAFVLIKLFGRQSEQLVNHLHNNFLMNLLVGFIGAIVAPIAVVLLLLSFVGYYIALIVLVLWIILMLMSGLLGAVFAGSWLVKKLSKKSELAVDWQAIVIGVVGLAIIKFIPVLGFLFIAVLFLASMGTLIKGLYGVIKANYKSEQAPVINS